MTNYRYPRPETIRRYLAASGHDETTYTQERLASTQANFDLWEARFESIQAKLDEILDECVYEVELDEIEYGHRAFKRPIIKTTGGSIWIEYNDKKLIRLPKEPLQSGEVVKRHSKNFAMGAIVRSKYLQSLVNAIEVMDAAYEELLEVKAAIALGRVPFPEHIHSLLLDLERFFVHFASAKQPTSNWRKVGF